MFQISEDWDLEVGHHGPAGAPRHPRRHIATFLHIPARGTGLGWPGRALQRPRTDLDQIRGGPELGTLVLMQQKKPGLWHSAVVARLEAAPARRSVPPSFTRRLGLPDLPEPSN